MIFFGKRREKTLFLVCPMDFMEPVIRERYKGNSFFYTALGVVLEFDEPTQHSLYKLIRKEEIDHITLVAKADGDFYQGALLDWQTPLHLPVERSLAKLKTGIAPRIERQKGSFLKSRMIIGEHLDYQRERLLNTELLGIELLRNGIGVNSLVYEPSSKSFTTTGDVLDRAKLFDGMMAN
ncbi:hypothetical protein [Aquimarina atlantica]|nr:hypothetical protein [Aquimarina atlantica]